MAAGAWARAFDKASFLAPLRQCKQRWLDALQAPGVDADEAARLLAEIDALHAFVDAIRRLDRPQPALQPYATPAPHAGRLFVLQVGGWRAFYLLDADARAMYGALVTHEILPTADRLAELLPPVDP